MKNKAFLKVKKINDSEFELQGAGLVKLFRKMEAKYCNIEIFSPNGGPVFFEKMRVFQGSRSGVRGCQYFDKSVRELLVLPRTSEVSIIFSVGSDSEFQEDSILLYLKKVQSPACVDINKAGEAGGSISDFPIQRMLIEDYKSNSGDEILEKSLNITVDVEDCYFSSLEMLESSSGIPTTSAISKILSDRGLAGTFFVNVYEIDFSVNSEKIRGVIKDLSDCGHEVGLHCHQHPKLPFYNKLITEYNYEQQREILEYGKKKLEDICGVNITSFRAGGYQHNDDTLRALRDVGIFVDSSILFPKYGDNDDKVKFLHPHLGESGCITRIPVTPVIVSGKYGGAKESKLDINWLKGSEIKGVLSGAGVPAHCNFMMHSFSFFKKKSLKPGQIFDSTEFKVSPENLKGRRVALSGFNEDVYNDFVDFVDYVASSGFIVETCSQTARRVSSKQISESPFIPVLHRG
ncbi:hypothetical protein HCU01_42150 [Halomonas cupida]|uniref:Polysaccharide deacetylase n=1 Tax=Halomonas cupida TaxID=44933 RepID=A0A1M7LVC4_9GAMM|nr:polysaccharide deacetylase family protein [Halomonas cupida]GEN26266.1 hypothetical protein HCU01_42150 [Halomonas cupida]SHM82184.1 Polysaccharide deacetylase [Halomonas cupida]